MRSLIFVAGIILIAEAAQLAHAASPRAELNASVERLQKTPDDATLREKIIKLAASVKPAPAIPEAAREHFIMATTMQKNAKSTEDYGQAVGEYRQALLAAPWWGDAYYNLAVAEESAGRFDDAIASLKLFLATKPRESDVRRAQDQIYALKARKKMKESDDDAKAVQEARRQLAERAKFVDSIQGHWQWGNNALAFDVSRSPIGSVNIACQWRNSGLSSIAAEDIVIDSKSLTFKCSDAYAFTREFDCTFGGKGEFVVKVATLRNGEPMMFNGHPLVETETYTH